LPPHRKIDIIMNVTRKFLASLLFLVSIALPVGAQNDDDEKTLKQAMEDAQKAAAKAGIKVPDAAKQLPMDLDEDEKESKAEEKKSVVHSPAVTLPLTKLPDWIPPVPDFQPNPNAVKKQEDGVETGKLTGVSSAPPEAIAEAWHEASTKTKAGFGQTDSNINGKKSIRVNFYDVNSFFGGGKVELLLEPGKKTKVEINYEVPIPSASPAAATSPQ
jgi:hypothetical protein